MKNLFKKFKLSKEKNQISANCIIVKVNEEIKKDPIDSKSIIQKSFRRKVQEKLLYVISVYNHRSGIRHVIFLTSLILYTLLGGLIFNAIESTPSKEHLRQTITLIEANIANLSNRLANIAEADNITVLIQDNYQNLLSIEGLYIGSAFQKSYDKELHENWDFISAMFYSMAIYTTIGYGTISCSTALGKAITIIYACVGIPLMLVVIADVGNILLAWFTTCYNLYLKIYRKITKSQFEEDGEFPTSISIVILIFYLILCALIVELCDYEGGKLRGLSFGDSLYFCFISMSTIGLGDVMPNNIQYSPLMGTLFLCGLALVSMVTNTAYDRMRKFSFGFIDRWDQALEDFYANHHKRDEEPLNCNTITINVPSFLPDYGYTYDSQGRRSLGIQVNLEAIFPLIQLPTPEINRYRRSYSSGRARIKRTLTPTLGIFATNDSMKTSNVNKSKEDVKNLSSQKLYVNV